MLSSSMNLLFGFWLSIGDNIAKGDSRTEGLAGSREPQCCKVQLIFNVIAMVGATHLHVCGFQTPIWWLRCLGHPSVHSNTCGLDGSCRQLVNWSWAFMPWEAALQGLNMVLVESVMVVLVREADNSSSGASGVIGFCGWSWCRLWYLMIRVRLKPYKLFSL